MAGRNAFITGAAGCGKTYLLDKFITAASAAGKQVAVTATTGLAASHLNGRTIHSWSGMGIAPKLDTAFLNKLKSNRTLRAEIMETDILIIDEISMLPSYRLDMVDRICRYLRGIDSPFGKLQVVLSGDFFQLSPIVDSEVLGQFMRQSVLAVGAEAWSQLQLVVCYLTKQYRQNTEDPLLGILNAMRNNQLTEEHVDLLRSRIRPSPGNVTELYCHNRSVDYINQGKVQQLPGATQTFVAQVTTKKKKSSSLVKQLLKNCLAEERLSLKERALVMFVQNDPQQKYINGTLGTVVGFNKKNGYPVVRTREGRTIYSDPGLWRIERNGINLVEMTQIPLKLAWAITIHKSQGMTLDAAFIDLSHSFEAGMGYVALSRLKDLENLYLKNFNETSLQVKSEVLAIDEDLRRRSNLFLQNSTL